MQHQLQRRKALQKHTFAVLGVQSGCASDTNAWQKTAPKNSKRAFWRLASEPQSRGGAASLSPLFG